MSQGGEVSNSRGFILPLDVAYLTAIGGVLAQWSVFELEFDRVLWVLRLNPDAKALSTDVPRALRKRIDLFRDSARECFASCPSLAEKLVQVSGVARATSRLRNLLAHGRWGVGENVVRVDAYHEGHAKYWQFTVQDLQDLRDRISENHGVLMDLTHIWMGHKLSHLLTSDERGALLAHYKAFWPKPIVA